MKVEDEGFGEEPLPMNGPMPITVEFGKAVYDEKEIDAVVRCLRTGWLGSGKISEEFERRYAEYIGVNYAQLVNSGSSANLLSLRACKLPEGSKVITCAAGFPSTMNVIWHAHLKPVVVDANPTTFNIALDDVEDAIKEHQPKAIIFAHTVGNPVDMHRVMELASTYDIKVIEDNCDAMGSEIYGKRTGSFGNFHTMSFYASHHITCGGMGGMVGMRDTDNAFMVKSMKEWGKDQITTGFESDHGVIFDTNIEGVPYDHRYAYPNIGYNFKLNEMSAAFGLAQMDRIDAFNSIRRKSYDYLRKRLDVYHDVFQFPEVHPKAYPAWFSFPILIRKKAPFDRKRIVEFLENNGIRTRLFFGGNILKQPGFSSFHHVGKGVYPVADALHEDAFLLGIHPALTKEMMDRAVDVINEFMGKP